MKKKVLVFITIIIALLQLTVNSQSLFENGKNLYSDNVYMVNMDTGKVVYELNAEEKVFPASLTKIMTCILAIEECENLDETVTIETTDIFKDVYADNGANIKLKAGEEISLRDLIKATMIRSSCDTATAIAVYISGSVEDFASLMNSKAREIGAKNTHFVNAHGLHDDRHYTTAKDLYLIANYALQNKEFVKIISENSCVIPATNKSEERVLESTIEIELPDNPMYYKYVTGIKSGFTDEAGRCLITKATKNSETYLLVTLGANRDRFYNSNMAFTDAITLYEYHFAEYSLQALATSGQTMTNVNVKNGMEKSVDLILDGSIETLVALDEKPDITFNLPDKVKAPVAEGEVIGSVTFKIGDETFTENLVAKNSVEHKSTENVFATFNNGNTFATVLDFTALFFLTISLIIIAVFLIKKFTGKI
ncbi:MAG: D-alanyl-D-alanine carboxypeptidase [Ruminococcaceae bacterium]|nr:D-alanyl-D-alanine carboxypeptidase [Oscillospiraceae bacterium]